MFSKIKLYLINEWQVNNPFVWLLLCVFVIQFLPPFGVFDIITVRWYILSLLNLVGFVYLLWNSKKLHVNKYLLGWKNKIFISYLLFLLFSIISIFYANNKPEGIYVFTHLILTFLTVIHFALLLNVHLRLFDFVVKVTHVLLLINVINLFVSYFYYDFASMGMKGLLALKGGYANKNIFAVALVLKIPFVVYSLYVYKRIWKIISAVLLFGAISGTFILMARASFLSMFVILFLVVTGCSIAIFRKQNVRYNLYFIFGTVLIFGLGFIVSQQITKYSAQLSKNQQLAGVTTRLKSINSTSSSAQARLLFWKNAVKIGNENFPLGCGIGNCKIESLKYENREMEGLRISKHVHNDFLELYAEIGVGVIFYILIFIFAFWSFILVQIKSRSVKHKLISWVSVMGLAVYTIDAVFNFPLQRTSIQIYFAFFLAINMITFIGLFDKSKMQINKLRVLLIFLIFIVLATTVVTYWAYKSSQIQYQTHYDQKSARYKFSYERIKDDFPIIPNINEICVPISVIKSGYLIHEGKYDEAIDLLLEDSVSNPYMVLRDMKLRDAFFKKGDTATAIFYGQRAVELRPKYYNNSKELAKLYSMVNETDSVEAVFEKYFEYYPTEPQAWVDQSNILFDCKKDYKLIIAGLDTAIQQIVDNKILYTQKVVLAKKKDLQKDVKAFSEQYIEIFPDDVYGYNELAKYYTHRKNYPQAVSMYNNALEKDSMHLATLYELADIYVKQYKYKQAIELLLTLEKAKESYKQGDVFYLLGYCYHKTKEKELMCNYLDKSIKFGNEKAQKLAAKVCPDIIKKKEEQLAEK